MAAQAGEFLRDIAAIGEECDLFEHPLVGGVELEAKLCQPLQQGVAVSRNAVPGMLRDGLPQGLQFSQPGLQVSLQGMTLLFPHGVQIVEGLFKHTLQLCFEPAPVGRGLFILDALRDPQQQATISVQGQIIFLS